MYNPPVLLEYVPLVRRLLAASKHPDVVRVGKLGEITYLVDELVERAEVEIYDVLIASMASRGGPRFGIRQMQERRDMFHAHVGENLLKAGMQWASRQYEIYVDPKTETVVHLSGFYLPDASHEEPGHATPADHARWIFKHPRDGSRGDGQRVVELLLAGRNLPELSMDELELLCRGYNWWGKHDKAFEAARLNLARAPHYQERFRLAGMYASIAFCHDLAGFVAACDSCIAESLGPAAFWQMLKADRYIAFATVEQEYEDFEWSPGDPILHAELLQPAAMALAAALDSSPGLREDESARGWVGDWNLRFAAVVQQLEFTHLAQEAGLTKRCT